MSSLHDHSFKNLPTDWRHDGPLSAKNDEKHMPVVTPPIVHDSDRMAAEEVSKCDEIRSIITDQINRHVAMIDTHRAWLADDITTRILAVIAPLFIARHHAEERAAVEKVKTIGEKWMQLKRDGEKPHDFGNPEPRHLVFLLAAQEQELILALTALRTASQSPTQ